MKSFSVVLATTSGRSETLERCLASVFANDYPQELFEVIVIDSGVDDQGLTVVESFKKKYENLKFYSPGWGNVGPAKARNLGIKKAKNDVVAFTDDDCLVPRGWLHRLNGGYQRHPEVVGVGGYLEAPADVLRSNIFAQYEKFHEWSQYNIRAQEFVSKKRDEAPFETNNISYKREVLERVGGFDEDYSVVRSGEDGDLKERVLKLGKPLLFVPIKVTHLQDYNFKRFFRQQTNRGGGILVYKRKRGMEVESRAELFLKILASPLVFFRYLIVDKFQVRFAFLDTLAFLNRQIGKLMFFRFSNP